MDSIKEILLYASIGVKDLFVGIIKVKDFPLLRRKKKTYNDADVGLITLIKKFFLCFCLNGIALGLFIYAFENWLLRFVELVFEIFGGDGVWLWLRPLLVVTFNLLWVLPLLVLSTIVNCVCFQDIADMAFEIACGRKRVEKSVSLFIADYAVSVFLQLLFVLQSCIVSNFPIPLIGELLSTAHMCLLYSLYAFEYKWINMGWPLRKRLYAVDYNWPYFIGYGLPLALLTTLTESRVSRVCIFSILFPLYVVSGINTSPAVGDVPFRSHAFDLVAFILNFLTEKVINLLKGNK